LPEFAKKGDQVGQRCLQKILGEKVYFDIFMEFVGWFGPFKAKEGILERMFNVVENGWFFGDLSSSEAAKLLAATRSSEGRFLVRLGHTIPGSFVVSFIKQGERKTVEHIVIRFEDGLYSCKSDKIKPMPTLKKVIKQLMIHHPKEIVLPCPGAPYASLFPYFEPDDK